MLMPRLRTSYMDALFCYFFVRLLVNRRVHGFHILGFYNKLSQQVGDVMQECCAREASILGVFTREMMSYVIALLDQGRREFNAYANLHVCFLRTYHGDATAPHVEY